MTARNYTNTANAPALTAGITGLATSLALSTISGWPSAPCYGVIDLGGSSPEVVLVQSIGVGTMTVLRAQGGTAGVAHNAGITITHAAVALDYSDANAHIEAASGVHGVAGAVVGATDAQVLTNKTLTSPGLDTATIRASASAPGSLNKAAASGSQDIMQWLTSASVLLGKVDVAGGLTVPLILVANTAAATIPARVKGAAAQTANLVSVQNSSAVEQLGVDKLGKVLVHPATDEATALLILRMAGLSANPIEVRDAANTVIWRVGPGGDQIVTGLALQPNGGFDKANTTDNKFRVDASSNVVLSGSKLTLDTAQANNVPTTPNNLGKQLHWGVLSGTTDASGFLSVTHGCGFTPLSVLVTPISPAGGTNIFSGCVADLFTGTTFRLRAFSPSAGALASVAITASFLCGQ